MTTRPFRPEDLPLLKSFIEASGFPYPDLNSPLIECIQVVVDDSDTPVAAYIAERIVQSYVLIQPMAPHAKLHVLRVLHTDIPIILKTFGYTWVEAYIPPELVKRFGRRLERSFGWVRSWPSWTKKL